MEASRPARDDRTLAVTQGGECQTGAGEHGQQEQDQQTQPRPLAPVTESAALSVTLGQLQGAGFDARVQGRAGEAGTPVDLAVLQRSGLLLAQANRFAEPETVEAGKGRRGHGNTRSGNWRRG